MARKRKTNLCKKTSANTEGEQTGGSSANLGLSSGQTSQKHTTGIATVQFPACVLLSYVYSWGLRQAFFSDFRRPWFPCGSLDGTTLPTSCSSKIDLGHCHLWGTSYDPSIVWCTYIQVTHASLSSLLFPCFPISSFLLFRHLPSLQASLSPCHS